MRSLLATLAIVLVIALSVSWLAFSAISHRVETQYFDPVFEATDAMQLEAADAAMQRGGLPALRAFMVHLDNTFGPSHYLLDGSGRDVITRRQMTSLLPSDGRSSSRGFIGKRFVVSRRSVDQTFWLLYVGPERVSRLQLSPFYLLVLAVTATLCCLAAIYIVRPIRTVTGAMVLFSQGDLSSRARLTRNDEIGSLARSFNEMAERLQAVLVREKQVLQDVSHELRSPLARLKLAVALARRSQDPGIAFDRIEREVERIAALSAEIIDVARLEGDPRLLVTEPVRMAELIEDAVRDACAEAQEPLICLQVKPGDAECVIVCNRELVQRAVENLLRNALRFGPAGMPVDVGVEGENGKIRLTVRDYGPGVPDAFLEKIFQPFFRVDEARGESGGIGLGLAIVKRIVQLHQGSINASNAKPGLLIEVNL